MGRPPKYSRRYHLTLEAADANLLDAYARDQANPAATIGTNLLVEALRRATSGTDEPAAERRMVADLQAANATLRRRLQAAGTSTEAPPVPRWGWAIEGVLADRAWWETWLPRLNELLGRRYPRYGMGAEEAFDARGYADLMAFLFPPVRQNGRVVAEWHAPEYPRWALYVARSEEHVIEATAPARPALWEPVIRHVVVALCALEQTSIPGADPVLLIRTENEVASSWLRTLRRLTGEDAADLPDAPS
jgi:hypothetical protein